MDFDKIRQEVKAKPLIGKDYFLKFINEAEFYVQKLVNDESKVIKIGKVFQPKDIKKYDIVMAWINNCPHPCIVYNVDLGFVYVLGMSTKNGLYSTHKVLNSRFFKNNHISHTLIRLKHEDALNNFAGVFDNKKEADIAFKKVKDFYNNLFAKK